MRVLFILLSAKRIFEMGNNKKNKQKTRLSPETKDKLKTGFGTLISNEMCIKAGREYPWYTPIILAVCSVLITLVPSFVNTMRVNMGDSVLGTSSVGGVENGLANFQSTLKAANASVKITDDGRLVVSDETKKAVYNAGTGDDQYYEYRDTVTDEPVLRVQFSSDFVDSSYLDALSKNTIKSSTTVTDSEGVTSEVADAVSTTYRVSILVFKDTGFSMAVYNRRINVSTNSTSALVNYSYDRLAGKDLLTLTPSMSLTESPAEYVAAVKKNYQEFITLGYETTKITLAWRNVGILAGINAGVILLLGLVLFLVTRGKRNPYRIITFWQCQKIGYWAAPAPAILALGLGFLLSSTSGLSSLSMFMFLFLYGLRIMWTSMKAFSPQGK